MNTISPNEDMFADFYQVGGYSNLAGASANLMSRGGSKGGTFTQLAQRGRNSKSFLGLAYREFTRVYDEIKQDFDLSDAEINRLYADYRNQGGKGVRGFKQFVADAEESKSKVQEQIIDDSAIALPTVEPSTPSQPQKTKPNLNYLYIGIGAVVLIGATILIVKK
jgi:hypothetical protein